MGTSAPSTANTTIGRRFFPLATFLWGEAVIEEKRKKKKKKKKKKALEEAHARKESDEARLWERVSDWVKAYGGKGKALYLGSVVRLCTLDGLVLDGKAGKRRTIPLKEVRKNGFELPGK